MNHENRKKNRLPNQSATGNAVFSLTGITTCLYLASAILIFGFPSMVELSIGLKFHHQIMGIILFACTGGHVIAAIFIKKREYNLGSVILIIVSIMGFLLGGGFLVGALFGFIAASIGLICDSLEQKLYERSQEREKK